MEYLRKNSTLNIYRVSSRPMSSLEPRTISPAPFSRIRMEKPSAGEERVFLGIQMMKSLFVRWKRDTKRTSPLSFVRHQKASSSSASTQTTYSSFKVSLLLFMQTTRTEDEKAILANSVKNYVNKKSRTENSTKVIS